MNMAMVNIPLRTATAMYSLLHKIKYNTSLGVVTYFETFHIFAISRIRANTKIRPPMLLRPFYRRG